MYRRFRMRAVTPFLVRRHVIFAGTVTNTATGKAVPYMVTSRSRAMSWPTPTRMRAAARDCDSGQPPIIAPARW